MNRLVKKEHVIEIDVNKKRKQSNVISMKPVERDLLILLHEDRYNEQEIQYEVKQISDMLSLVETMDYLATATEVADCNKHRVSSKRRVLERAFFRKEPKAFEFIVHKN
ncbi:hypothetical protein DLD77_07645 [Chitinophaga alhagiae]|uniref:Phosphoribosyl-ATP pyrophosphohydrolase n=1 Tax=Chitinophaga alhagiae TaxID=2203219 RepID=A0ABN5LQD8_9BACT|nr:hypothetical protein DLD77_07645 [Chitinophaga alhagiae]